ncbi:unnamed protein product [Sphagnum jensenii]|uniref:Protein kinase domain-containing protein n=1 Tax=Sphagnum jensenii TaxID=128206 RepID=A0ABP0W825_9BRYO
MAYARDSSSSGLDKGPNGVGQVTHFLSATRSFRNRELQNDPTTSNTGEHTYYSTAPQELWTELLPKDLQGQNFVSNTQNNEADEAEFSCVEVHLLGQSDLLLLWLLAEGGQAHVYSAECEKFSTPVVVKRLKHGNVDLFRLQRRMEMMYFDVKIGDFETSDGVVGTRFWRAPEVLQAVKTGGKPILTPAADVYSYGMLCYELLTGRIPFEECAWTAYDVILSGKRPELPAYVTATMKQLLHDCWLAKPRNRPGWTSIINALKEELMLHPPGLQQPKRRAQPRIETERKEIQNSMRNLNRLLYCSPWVVAAVQGLGKETFETWEKKVSRDTLTVLHVFSELIEAFRQDPYSKRFLNPEPTFWERNPSFNKVLYAFDEAWQLVKETWANHVTGVSRLGESGTDGEDGAEMETEIIDGSEMETLDEGQIDVKRETERTVWEIWANNTLEPYDLLGSAAEDWLKKALEASEEWEVFRATLNAWRTENRNSFRSWQKKLQNSSSAWKKVCVAIHAWHVEGPTAFIVWQILKKEENAARPEYYSLPESVEALVFEKGWSSLEEDNFQNLVHFYISILYQDIVSAEINLKVHKATNLEVTMRSIKAWKAVEVEKVTIRSLFLENTIDIATRRYV